MASSPATESTCLQSGSWNALPEEVVERLAVHLERVGNAATLRSLRSVNRHWRRCVSKRITHLKITDLEREELPAFLQKMKELFSKVHRLDVPVVWMDDECCHQFASHLPWLKSMEVFWGDAISDEGLKALAAMQLESLRIYHSRLITDKGIEVLSGTSLKELWLYGANLVTDDGFRNLVKLSTLQVLRLLYCNRLTRYGLEPLFDKDGLQLFVRFCRRISREISIS